MHRALRFLLVLTVALTPVGAEARIAHRVTMPTDGGSQLDSRGFDLFEAGQKAHQAGHIEEAIKLYDQAIALEPELWTAHYQRGVALLQLGRPADAEPSLRKAIDLEPDFAAAKAALGQTLIALDRPADAEPFLVRALEIDPGVPGARANLAIVLWKRNAYADVDRELTKLESMHQADAANFVLHGKTLELLKRAPDAIAAYTSAIALEPSNADALAGRGRLRAAAGDKEAAVADLKASLAARPDPDVARELSRLTGTPVAPADAIETLKATIAANPNDLAARRALADALGRAGRLVEAKKEIEALESLAPNDPDTYDVAGDVLLDESALSAARKYLQAVRLAPDNVGYRLKLGSALIRAAQYEAALQHFEFAVAKEPERREGHAGYAAALYGAGRYADAAREFEWITAREPKSTIALYYLGASLDRLGDCKGALDAFDRFLGQADASADKQKIDEVNLRIPGIRRQMDHGDCKKVAKKPA